MRSAVVGNPRAWLLASLLAVTLPACSPPSPAPWVNRFSALDATPNAAWGLLPNGLRDKFAWPFASDSLWNAAIGSQARYEPAGIVSNVSGGQPTVFSQDEDVNVMRPSAPVTAVYYNGAGWSRKDRCPAQGPKLTQLPVPANYVLPGNTLDNRSSAFLMPDGRTVEQNQPFTRCTVGGIATALVTFADTDIYGRGPHGAHGGSNLSALGGTIRLGEFASGKIHHAMKIELWAKQYYYCCTYHWPATTVDGYANHKTYGGNNPDLGPGALLALLPQFEVKHLRTQPARILAQAFKDYGAYIVDDTAWNAWNLAVEQSPDGRVVNEFRKLYGYPMNVPEQKSAFMLDLIDVFQHLQIVANNSSRSVGGGGTPRQPAPPPIGN